LLPSSQRADKIDYFREVLTKSYKYRSYATPILYTKSGLKLQLPENYDHNFSDTCSLIVNRSFLLRIPVNVIIQSNGSNFTFETSILNRPIYGKYVIALLAFPLTIVLFQFCTKRKVNINALYISAAFTFCLLIDSLLNISSLMTG
jgi:hypothetical protein